MIPPNNRRPLGTQEFTLIAARVLAVCHLVIGAFLVASGVWLVVLEGPWYCVVAGTGLVVSADLRWRGKVAGICTSLAVFAFPGLWAIWEIGLNF